MQYRQPPSIPPADRHPVPALWALRILAVVALSCAAYLAWASTAGRAPAGCGEVGDCETVLATRWSAWFGLPVSLGAVAVYAGIFAASITASPRWPVVRRRRSWAALTALAVLAGGS